MGNFDINKPYGVSRKAWLLSRLGIIANGLVVLGDTLLCVCAVSVLWGWYFLGLFSCVMLLARTIDGRTVLRQLLRGQRFWRKGERVYLIYFLGLVTVAVLVNVVFGVLYLIGAYAPPFGNIPFG